MEDTVVYGVNLDVVGVSGNSLMSMKGITDCTLFSNKLRARLEDV